MVCRVCSRVEHCNCHARDQDTAVLPASMNNPRGHLCCVWEAKTRWIDARTKWDLGWPRAGPGPTLARPSWPRVELAWGHGPAGLARPLEGQGQGPVKVGWPWPGPARGQCSCTILLVVNKLVILFHW